MNFEEYPNDVQRGFNLWHMPVWYTTGKDQQPRYLYSNSMLIMTPEPDFSMPFNVNAVTHMLFGVLVVNTVFALYKDREEEETNKE